MSARHLTDDEVVAVLDEDPDLAAGLPPSEFALARHQARARVLVLGPADRELGVPGDSAKPGWPGPLLLEGMLLRRVRIGRRAAGELFGPGDLIPPWDADEDYQPLAISVQWQVLAPARLAVLDLGFARRVARWPELAAAITGRAAQRARALSLISALTHLPRAYERLPILLWLLAERWGTFTPQGVRLTLPVTHDILASLISTERPTVTIALQRLGRADLVIREGRNRWLLTNAAIECLSSPETVDLIERIAHIPT